MSRSVPLGRNIAPNDPKRINRIGTRSIDIARLPLILGFSIFVSSFAASISASMSEKSQVFPAFLSCLLRKLPYIIPPTNIPTNADISA